MTITEYLSSHRTSSEDFGNFMGNILSTYYNLSTDLNVTETNELLADFFSQTKFDAFSNFTYSSSISYDVSYDNGTSSLLGTEVNKVSLFFPTCEDMVRVIEELRIQSRSSINNIYSWSLNTMSLNCAACNIAGLVPSVDTWVNYYNVHNVLATRSSKSIPNPNGLSTTDIASILAFHVTKPATNNAFINAFISSFGYTLGPDLTDVEFNEVMVNIYSINRLGSWENMDIEYASGSFVGTDLALFRSYSIKETELFDLVQKLMDMGYTYNEVLTLDIPYASTLYEHVHLAL